MALLHTLALIFSVCFALTSAQIRDYNCTQWTPNGIVYSWQAAGCEDVMTESYCKARYPNLIYPAEGGNSNRAQACYMSGSGTPASIDPIDEAAKAWAISFCPKTCGYCCETSAFNCQNKNEKVACHTVTRAQCESPNWRAFLADECPATCGYCFYKECVDIDPACSNDICDEPTLQGFVSWYCRRTCKKCEPLVTSTTTKRPGTKEFTRPLLVF